MKKIIAFALALCLTLLYPVSAFAAENLRADEPVLVYRAEQITDPNQLMMRAQLGIDERSNVVKQSSSIQAKTNSPEQTGVMSICGNMQDALFTTQLVERELQEDGSVIELYATAAIARSSYTSSNSETEKSVVVTAMVNYSTRTLDGVIVECKLDNTQHRTVYPTSVTASNLSLTNKIDNGLEILYSNSRTIASPANNTWYTLSSPTSGYFSLSHRFQATTTVTASNGANPYVMCQVDLHTALS